ncbi:MAG: hypothetical protein A3F13_01010 [Gammaproteobacteria bacterium RIFCSPHIGHO2_12_FULL_40_19]|nr:MAG: hypothetical protein A3F13_01010 [Gammaproteobacteria bacterium RIFCSPHIGHO2_12_FULL_40_19]
MPDNNIIKTMTFEKLKNFLQKLDVYSVISQWDKDQFLCFFYYTINQNKIERIKVYEIRLDDVMILGEGNFIQKTKQVLARQKEASVSGLIATPEEKYLAREVVVHALNWLLKEKKENPNILTAFAACKLGCDFQEFERTLNEIDIVGRYEDFFEELEKTKKNIFDWVCTLDYRKITKPEEQGNKRLEKAKKTVRSVGLYSGFTVGVVALALGVFFAVMAPYLMPLPVLVIVIPTLLAWILGRVIACICERTKGRGYFSGVARNAVLDAIQQDRQKILGKYPLVTQKNSERESYSQFTSLLTTRDSAQEIKNKIEEMRVLRETVLACDHSNKIPFFGSCCSAGDMVYSPNPSMLPVMPFTPSL